MKLLILGADGMLGRAWTELAEARGLDYRGALYPDFDLGDAASIERVVTDADVVINCAAYTDVDGAETDEARATEINGAGVGRLVARCDAIGARLVHYSTDYVFDGEEREAPYPVDHPTAPLNAYGRSKLVGDTHVLSSAGAHLVLRTSWLYAPWAKNFVKTIASLAASRDALKVVDDQRGRPSSAEHLAEVSLRLVEAGANGPLHVTDGGECTWFDFATAIAAHANPKCVVSPCSSDEYPRPAKRPAYSVLDLAPTEAIAGPMRPWQHNLAAVLAALGASED